MPTASRDPASEIPPEDALTHLAARLRDDETVASAEVIDPATKPHLGMLVAAGPRAAEAPGDYSFVVESVREGYLLHYGTSRLLSGVDPDLALLAGDYLYALGIEHLSRLGDEAAVVELSDLISLCAQVHTESMPEVAGPLWLTTTCAVGSGAFEPHAAAKAAVRQGDSESVDLCLRAARDAAEAAGLGPELGRASKGIESAAPLR